VAQTQVRDFVSYPASFFYSNFLLCRSDTNGQYWLGAVRDPEDKNNWKWINGDDVTISFWNLPGGNEDCSRYDGSKGWLWSDTNCNAKLNYICQHRKFYH
jgi:Lectin C-type domain